MKGEQMITIEKLNEYGADTKSGLARCMGNEILYLRLVSSAADQTEFEKLKGALEANDLKGAFEAAHALKGVLGNLSLTPLYEKASEMTELLRKQTEMDYSPLLTQILSLREELRKLI